MVPTSLGRYEILEPLGKGGMGEVYRAHDPNLKRDVAIKVLPRELASDPDRIARLEREARLLAALNHPNVATIYGLEEAQEEDGTSSHFLILELVEGQTLAERLRSGPLDLEEAFEISVQIARGLEAAHARGIVHRDLKPGNVKITPDGFVKVLDLGLAKPSEAVGDEPDDEDLARSPTITVAGTEAGVILGTAAYMSPEQARGEKVDRRVDIWSFGCVLYEMLTGQRPFAGDSVQETLAAVLRDTPDWTALPAETPVRVRSLMRRCLSRDPDRRWHHIADARIELEEAWDPDVEMELSSESAADGRRDSSREPRREDRGSGVSALWRSPPSVRALLAVLLLVAATTAAWYLLPSTGTGEVTDRSIAVLPFQTLGQEDATAFTDGIHGDVLTRLSKISDLRVVSRTSVMRYRRSDKSLPEIAGELGVTWILRADVQEVGNQVQVNARLTNAERDQQVWAESYRRELTAENLFRIQGEVTEKVVTQLQARLSPQEERAVQRAPTEDLDAYRLYVRGRALLEQRSSDTMRRAVDYFRQALDRDSGYALAWAGLADALVLMNWYGYPSPETGIEPMEAIQRALEINPDLGEAHAALGLLHSYRSEGPPAVRALERAVELQPSYAQAHGWLCFVYLLVGQPEKALGAADRASELNPPPETRAELAEVYLANGDAQRALVEARRALQLQPDYGLARFLEGLALYELGRFADAEPVMREASVAFISPGHVATLALIAQATGNEARARELLAETRDTGDDAFWTGLVLAALGETEAAFEAFERVDRWSDWPTLPFRYYYPDVLGPMRENEEYRELLREVNRSWGLNPDGSLVDGG